MTKRMLVFLPCLIVALAFAGCGTDGDGGSAKKASSPFASFGDDPMAESMEVGYISTVAPTFSDQVPGLRYAQPAMVGESAVPQQVFMPSANVMKAMKGQVGVSTVAPMRSPVLEQRLSEVMATATDEGDGNLALTVGGQTSYLRSVAQQTAVLAADGSVSLGSQEGLPEVVEAPDGSRSVIMASGSLVPVK
jgi:hypothetical protein